MEVGWLGGSSSGPFFWRCGLAVAPFEMWEKGVNGGIRLGGFMEGVWPRCWFGCAWAGVVLVCLVGCYVEERSRLDIGRRW